MVARCCCLRECEHGVLYPLVHCSDFLWQGSLQVIIERCIICSSLCGRSTLTPSAETWANYAVLCKPTKYWRGERERIERRQTHTPRQRHARGFWARLAGKGHRIFSSSVPLRGAPALCFQVQDATRLSFENNSFDLVGTFQVLHHIPDWQTAFGEMARVLEPGGYLLFSDFVAPAWLAPLAQPLLGKGALLTPQTLAAQAQLCQLTYIHHDSKFPFDETIFMKK
ncbi:MAG: class I SAM-dependent methyltransferase [Chloroflexi bacterium]|nr:class I SAM-dependent methyltransferase [Chloroflexota bacterium]